MYLYTILTAYVFYTFCCTFSVRDDYLTYGFFGCSCAVACVGWVVVVGAATVFSFVLLLLLSEALVSSQLLLITLFLNPTNGPIRIFALTKGLL